MGAAVIVHSEESFKNTMVQIQNGTYESHYQKRMGTKTDLPSKALNNGNKETFSVKLANLF